MHKYIKNMSSIISLLLLVSCGAGTTDNPNRSTGTTSLKITASAIAAKDQISTIKLVDWHNMYIVNSDSNSVSNYKYDYNAPLLHNLTQGSTISSNGDMPTQIAVPEVYYNEGSRAYVTNFLDNSISIFNINQETGELDSPGIKYPLPPDINGPVDVKIVLSHLIVVTYYSHKILDYEITSDGLVLRGELEAPLHAKSISIANKSELAMPQRPEKCYAIVTNSDDNYLYFYAFDNKGKPSYFGKSSSPLDVTGKIINITTSDRNNKFFALSTGGISKWEFDKDRRVIKDLFEEYKQSFPDNSYMISSSTDTTGLVFVATPDLNGSLYNYYSNDFNRVGIIPFEKTPSLHFLGGTPGAMLIEDEEIYIAFKDAPTMTTVLIDLNNGMNGLSAVHIPVQYPIGSGASAIAMRYD